MQYPLAGLTLAAALLAVGSCGVSLEEDVQLAYEALPAALDYNIDVRPVLSDKCWSCHGPDAGSRMAGLRLDTEEGAFAKTADHAAAILPGNAAGSELVKRVLSHDPEFHMPTPESNLALTAHEKAILVKWVEDGARYDPHWAFTPLPVLAQAEALAPERVDEFIREGYETAGLTPQGQAAPRELVRRVYRDLTGLPPTSAQTQAFLADPSEAHYVRLVDSLLASDAAAEHLTREWLDVARYADSHGLHADGIRTSWPWRDWVIEAFRQNKPYDEFVTEQLAGDLMPGATEQQILATAFNRNHVMTGEGGANMEEFRMQYVQDRTNTFSTAFLGLTTECAACHDHKFDPISQAEYYSLTAFFNNVKEFGMTGDDGDFGPLMMLASEETKEKLGAIDARIEQLQHSAEAVAQQINFINTLPRGPRPAAHLTFDDVRGERAAGYPASKVLDTLFTVPGVAGQAYYFDTEWDAVDLPLEPLEAYDPLSVSMYVRTVKREEGKWQTLIANNGDKNGMWRGVDFALSAEGRLNFRLVHSLPGHYIEVESRAAVGLDEWTHVGFAYDGSSAAAGVTLYLDGRPTPAEPLFDKLRRSTYPLNNDMSMSPLARPYRIAVSGRHYTGEVGNFRGAIDEVKLWERELTPVEMAGALVAPLEPDAAARERHEEMVAQRPTLNKLRTLRKERQRLANQTMDIMVMADMPTPRQAYRLDRGNFDMPAEAVDYGTPASVLAFDPERYPQNRLGLAQWLFAEDNPLTARVTVNRYWQHVMGRGLVATAHDFGMQGELPSHPALLDYLANGFRASGYDVRALLRTIALSDTYRLSAEIDAATLEADPDNAYYTRATSYRYPAESIRDYALAVSGLLVPEVGGPSVRPYQPEGLWLEKSSFSKALYEYVPQHGDSLYRRSMYTFIRRTSPPPAMLALDQPGRDRCTVTRERTNTPLQALVLLNDPQFVEAARVLAQSVLAEGESAGADALIEAAFAKTLGRAPDAAEAEALKQLYGKAERGFGESPSEADDLLAVGEYGLPRRYDRTRLASLTVVANTLLNHDEIYTRR